MAKIKGILFDGANEPKVVEIEKDLQAYYELLDCDIIDIITRRVKNHLGETNITIIVDDNGLLKNRTIAPSGYLINNGKIQEILLGKIFVCDEDENGEPISLSDEKIQTILESVVIVFTKLNEYFDNEIITGKLALVYNLPVY